MLGLMAGLLVLGVLVGSVLLGSVMQAVPERPPRHLRLVHGIAGGVGALIAAVSLWRGVQSPGALQSQALGMVIVALLLGVLMSYAGHTLGRRRGAVLFVHAMVGSAGAAILAAWALG